MWPATTGRIRWSLSRMLVLWCLLSLYGTPGALFGGESETPPGPAMPKTAFVLTIHEGLLSLQATEASLQEILDAIGRRMHLEVVTPLPVDQTVTLAFDRLPLDAALKRFSRYANIAALSRKEQGQITHVTVLPKRGGPEPLSPAPGAAERVAEPERGTQDASVQEEPPRPQPFRFTFDPAQFLGAEQ